jgi:indolepyruvate ferredoxin oxidoreductase, beta subunit
MSGQILKLAILAVGGQGGGVLTSWIEDLARGNGYTAQATSVAGVAQRTGATIYYIEVSPVGERTPVYALMPAAGDVDVMITAELMEAGRSIIRGFVTPDRTTLITSTHRALAVSEKLVPGDGIASAEEVLAAAEIAARRLITADFEALALGQGSVISASLFGALAAAEVLPFPVAAFEAAIRAGGKGAEASLRAFRAGYAAVLSPVVAEAAPKRGAPQAQGPKRLVEGWRRLEARVAGWPAPVQALALPGLRKVVEFQDLAYGAEYLDRVQTLLALDDPARGHVLSAEAAKYIANAMAYDDVIRVAGEKTKAPRMARIAGEMGASADQVMQVTEFFHPRAEEIIGLLPARLGARLDASPAWRARIGRWFGKGRRLRSDRLTHFLLLHMLAGLKPRRRGNLRHAQEVAHLEAWLAEVRRHLPQDHDLAVEVLRCRRLIKGYSDTHERGQSKYDRVLQGVAQVAGRQDAADWARRLREAALTDEEGKALDGALRTIASFT